MNKWLRLLTVCGVGLIVVAALLMWIGRQPVWSQSWLLNGGFEGEYVVQSGEYELRIAPDWNLWARKTGEEYLDAPFARESAAHLHQGLSSQLLYPRGSKIMDACLYQQISGITVGQYIRFSTWAMVDTDDPLDGPDKWQTRIGIDPLGRTDPLQIQWETHQSLWNTYTGPRGQWQQLTIAMKAISPTVTVYACAHPIWPVRFNVYWDDASFAVLPEKLIFLPIVERNFCDMPAGALYNPDLEENFCNLNGYQRPIPGYDNVFVAPYWMPFWNDNYGGGENAQPEYNYTDRSYRVHSGRVAQQYGKSANQDVFEAGIYQVVTGTFNISDTIEFTIWGLGWSSTWANKDNERYSDVRDGLRFKVGIDPTGGASYTSTQIIWSSYADPYDEWRQFVISTTMVHTSTRISVWAYAHPMHSWASWNQVFWDTANLTVIPAAP